ncbi:MAG: alpha/beta hydrolase-fold protein [Bacteroidota bacterium]
MTFRTIEISDSSWNADGLRFVTVKSPSLKGRVDMSVYLSENAKGLSGLPVIVLLHGVFGSHWAWALKGGAHQVLQELMDEKTINPFVLVMPSDGLWGDGSGYVPHRLLNFDKWIGEELPALIRQQFAEVDEDSPFYIGGLSMGGYGAFRIGLLYRKNYFGISAHSTMTAVEQMTLFVEEDWSWWPTGKDAILDLIKNNGTPPPSIRFDCGTEDLLIAYNRELHRQLEKLGVEHDYSEYPGGHKWAYWHEHVRKTFLFFNRLYRKKNNDQ